MSISTTTSRVDYTGNGASATFPYPFKIFAATELHVIETDDDGVETVLVYNTNYTVSGVGDTGGGNVIRSAGNLPTDYTWTIRRIRPLTQTTSIKNQGEYFAKTHEDTFDKITMILQQLNEELQRCLKLAISTDVADFDPTLPPALEASRMLMVDEEGLGFALGPTPDELSQAGADALAAAASAVAAAASALAASGSATTASNHVVTASRWAKQTEDVTVVDAVTSVDSGLFSALHYAAKAAASAVAAAASAATAAAGIIVGGTRAAPNNITTAGITATTDSELLMFVQGSGGAITVTANPQISAGTTVGQRLMLVGRSDANTLTLANGTGLSLNGNITLDADLVLSLFWDGTNWTEITRSR